MFQTLVTFVDGFHKQKIPVASYVKIQTDFFFHGPPKWIGLLVGVKFASGVSFSHGVIVGP
jgi:hypothetical protein